MKHGPMRSTAHVDVLARPAARWDAMLVAVALLMGAFSIGNAQAPVPVQNQGITATGSGTAYGSPDTAIVDLGVSIYHADVSAAMSRADEIMVAIREALVAAGVD